MASIKKIAEELNWDLEKNTTYGSYNGYTISLKQIVSYSNSQNNFKVLVIPVQGLKQTNIQQLETFIKANKKELKILDFQFDQDTVVFRLIEMFKGFDGEKITSLLDVLLGQFAKFEIEPKENCVYCGESHTDTYGYVNDIKFKVHETCKQKAIAEVSAMRQQYDNQSSPIQSVFGAILGAVIGVIPYIIAVWFGWYIGLFTLITGFSSYFFFQKSGGKTVKSTKILISVITFVTVVLSNFAIVEFIALQNYVTIADVLAVPELYDIFIEMLGMSALFGLLGVTAVYARIKRDEFSTEVR